MILERIYDDGLAQASYLVGSERTGEALIVDPARDVARYVAAAEARKLRITHVTETHIHADFLSGARDLAATVGARLMLSGEGGEDWSYAFAAEAGAILLRDGDRCNVGDVTVQVLHTPGHTPEHLTFIITDRSTSDRPLGMLTGDFLFVGDVGRPDLLERAAKVEGTADASARALFESLQRIRAFPDYLQVWPGHGAGSACGKALGAMPSSTLGYERIANWGFAIDDEEEFVKAVLAGQPEPPRYFGRMKRLNRDGPPSMPVITPRRASFDEIVSVVRSRGERGWVIDTRSTAAFGDGFIPGTINLPTGSSFETWAGSLLPDDREILLIVSGASPEEEVRAARSATERLARIGLDRVAGFAGAALLDESTRRGNALATMPRVTAHALAAREGVQIVDVRGDAEWSAGHIPDSIHLFLGDLPSTLGELSRDEPVVVACQGGTRASIAGSILRAHGFEQIVNFAGGFGEWSREGLPIEQSDAPAPAPTSR